MRCDLSAHVACVEVGGVAEVELRQRILVGCLQRRGGAAIGGAQLQLLRQPGLLTARASLEGSVAVWDSAAAGALLFAADAEPAVLESAGTGAADAGAGGA